MHMCRLGFPMLHLEENQRLSSRKKLLVQDKQNKDIESVSKTAIGNS